MKKSFIILFSFCLAASASELKLNNSFVRAEIAVESGGNSNAVGDGGKAIGVVQIRHACWSDVKRLGESYTNCFNSKYSIEIMTRYLNRYAKKEILNNNFEGLARCWNSGPGWKNKIEQTNLYWNKVNKELNKK